MPIVLHQLSAAEVRGILESDGSFSWPGFVHPGALPPPIVLRRALARVAAGEPVLWSLPFLIVDPSDQAVAGGCAFKGAPKNGRAEVLYGVSRNCRGRGVASAAVTQLAEIAFAHGASEVLAEIDPRNAGSIGVARRCGFQRAGERTAEDGVVVEQWLLVQPVRAQVPS